LAVQNQPFASFSKSLRVRGANVFLMAGVRCRFCLIRNPKWQSRGEGEETLKAEPRIDLLSSQLCRSRGWALSSLPALFHQPFQVTGPVKVDINRRLAKNCGPLC